MYGTSLFIGWFPLAMWMHHCRVGFDFPTYSRGALLILFVFTIGEISRDEHSLSRIGIELGILAITLPLVFLL
ncbi:MAG: hypothetical protein AAF420_10745, partial [Pseudomonadota bacterium]